MLMLAKEARFISDQNKVLFRVVRDRVESAASRFLREATVDVSYEGGLDANDLRAIANKYPDGFNLSDIPAKDVKETFCVGVVSEVAQELEAAGYTVAFKPYYHAYGLVGCRMVISW